MGGRRSFGPIARCTGGDYRKRNARDARAEAHRWLAAALHDANRCESTWICSASNTRQQTTSNTDAASHKSRPASSIPRQGPHPSRSSVQFRQVDAACDRLRIGLGRAHRIVAVQFEISFDSICFQVAVCPSRRQTCRSSLPHTTSTTACQAIDCFLARRQLLLGSKPKLVKELTQYDARLQLFQHGRSNGASLPFEGSVEQKTMRYKKSHF